VHFVATQGFTELTIEDIGAAVPNMAPADQEAVLSQLQDLIEKLQFNLAPRKP